MDGVRVQRWRGVLGEAEYAFGTPHPSLRGHVRRYLGYVECTVFQRRSEPPSGWIPLIVNLGEPLRLSDPREPGGSRSYADGFVAGPHDAAALVDSGGRQSGLQVDFTPIGAHLLLGVPLGHLRNAAVDLADLPGFTQALVDRLRAAPSWSTRFGLLDAFVRSRFAVAPDVPADLVRAWRRLEETSGALGVGALAAELGCSRKHLSSRFAGTVGLPPKTLGRILRFHAVVRALAVPGGELAEIAARCGYYDQAHLHRDFREFAGNTPAEYLRRTADGFGVVAD